MITSWAEEEDKANAKYDAIRGKSKQNFNKRLNLISLDRFIYLIYLCYLRSLVD
jgi:hypothetical protein